MQDLPEKGRSLLARLQQGPNTSESPLYHSSLAQSDYSVLFTSNASELVRATRMTDFAALGALYMIRHGLELWLKCVIANHCLDQILRVLIREGALSFEELCSHDVMTIGRSKKARIANIAGLRRGLCVMRNTLVDGLGNPECWTKRISDYYANQALTFLRQHPSTPRQRIAIHYVPLVSDHNLEDLWTSAEPYVDGLRRGAQQHADDVGGGPPLELTRLEELVVFLHHLDPDGDALRYPFSLRGEWYAHQLRLSLEAIGTLARDLTESTRCFRDYRSDVYEHGTVDDPSGPLYFGRHP